MTFAATLVLSLLIPSKGGSRSCDCHPKFNYKKDKNLLNTLHKDEIIENCSFLRGKEEEEFNILNAVLMLTIIGTTRFAIERNSPKVKLSMLPPFNVKIALVLQRMVYVAPVALLSLTRRICQTSYLGKKQAKAS
ncbi:hypothetical protein TNCV_4378131 [Trichonephila clavipes]|nr:hypothetical protein TNCV_4378131 [Trichonephila clavipes]